MYRTGVQKDCMDVIEGEPISMWVKTTLDKVNVGDVLRVPYSIDHTFKVDERLRNDEGVVRCLWGRQIGAHKLCVHLFYYDWAYIWSDAEDAHDTATTCGEITWFNPDDMDYDEVMSERFEKDES